ncbi:MAG: hypothetical protein ACREC9_15065 [Methylocella sp.]
MVASLVQKQVKLGDGVTLINIDFIDINSDGTQLIAVYAGQLSDGINPLNRVSVGPYHTGDNQALPATGNALLSTGVALLRNPAGGGDLQRGAGFDQAPARGLVTGANLIVQEFQQTSTTTVAAAALTATLSIANTTGFQVGGSLNFEPATTGLLSAKYESALITAVVANTSVTIQFGPNGALFAHTQPYLINSFVFNQQRDFAGEGPCVLPSGAEIAAEFESNSGGPLSLTGLPTGFTLDADRNLQGKNSNLLAITSTTGGSSTLQFTGNCWTSGLVPGQSIILSTSANAAAVEEVIVSKNNVPVTGAGPVTVNLANPILNSGSQAAVFDIFGLNIPTGGATPVGTGDSAIWLYDPVATDPKRPLKPLAQAPSHAGAALVSADGVKATYRYALLAFAPVATPTDIVVIQGSATKTIRVKRIKITGAATSAGNMPAQLIKRTSAGTLGSAVLTAITTAKHDTNDPAATAVVSTVGTANYTTLGTSAGGVGADRLQMAALATGVAAPVVWDFATRQDKAFVLRGAAEFLNVNLNGATVPAGGVIDIEIEIEEDNS